MRLVFESTSALQNISQAFSLLTDGSRICLNDIRNDEKEGTVVLYLHRNELTGFKKSIFGVKTPVYSQTMIGTWLKIRQVIGMDLQVDDILIKECNSTFTALFGIKVEENELYLGSVEEAGGKTLCQIRIKVKGINIELVDELGNQTTGD